MSTYTNFLKLRKPDETEKYSISHFNANADLIDSALARIEQKDESQDNLFASKISLETHANNHNNPHAVSKSQIGLGKVENKSSSDLRSEITRENITSALGYTPYTPNEVNNRLTELETKISRQQHTHNNKTVLDGINSSLVENWNNAASSLSTLNSIPRFALRLITATNQNNTDKSICTASIPADLLNKISGVACFTYGAWGTLGVLNTYLNGNNINVKTTMGSNSPSYNVSFLTLFPLK